MNKRETVVSMIDDPRPIGSISWGETYGDAWWKVGHKYREKTPCGHTGEITKILVYYEAGQFGHVPWVAVFVGEEIIVRADCAGAQITYM